MADQDLSRRLPGMMSGWLEQVRYSPTRAGATGFTSASVLLGGQTGGATSAAVDGNLAVVGSGNADSGAGRVFVLEMGDEGWDVAAEFETAFVDLYPSVTGGQVECAEGVAEGFDCSEIDMLSFVSLGDLGGGKGIRMNDVWDGPILRLVASTHLPAVQTVLLLLT